MYSFLTGLAEIREGGSYHRFSRMIRALGDGGFKTYVYSTSPNVRKNKNVIWKQILKYMPPFIRKGLFFLLFPFIALRYALFSNVRRFIAFGPVYACLLMPFKLSRRCLVICMVRGMLSNEYFLQERNRGLVHLISTLEYAGFFVSDRIITVSESFRKDIQHRYHINHKKVVCLPNEIPDLKDEDINFEYGEKVWEEKTDDHNLRLLTGGVITPIKNYESIFHALKNLDIPYHVCIAGKPANELDYQYFGQLKALAVDLKIEDKITWLGWLDRGKLLGVLKGSHLFISASHHEGMSNILLEALALDVPCMAKDTPESLELIGSKDLLFETSEDLAKLLKKYYSEEDFTKAVTKVCKRAKKKWTFDWDKKLIEMLT